MHRALATLWECRSLIPFVGNRRVMKELDERFDKKTVVAILFGVSLGKVVEKLNILVTHYLLNLPDGLIVHGFIPNPLKLITNIQNLPADSVILFFLWSAWVPVVVWVSAYWNELGEKVEEVKETAEEKAEEVGDAVSGDGDESGG